MNTNPYTTPNTETAPKNTDDASKEKLRKIAFGQRAVNICVLVYIIAGVSIYMVPPSIGMVISIVFALTVVAAAICGFLLAIRVYPLPLAIVLLILCFIPLLGFLILLCINDKATKILKKGGVKVGLLGANPNRI